MVKPGNAPTGRGAAGEVAPLISTWRLMGLSNYLQSQSSILVAGSFMAWWTVISGAGFITLLTNGKDFYKASKGDCK